jgi:hypothetical protein
VGALATAPAQEGSQVRPFTTENMNAAIRRVEIAKQNDPVGWRFLAPLGLRPPDSYVAYAFMNADAHVKRLGRERDPRVIYSAGWLNGLAIGTALDRGQG